MTTLLRIDSSARRDDSFSRQLGDAFESAWCAQTAQPQVVRRDLAANPIPHIAEQTIAGFYTPDDQLTPQLREATALSDQLIAELEAADAVLITAPMYNFSVPSALKAWVDQIVRINRTFAYDGTNFTGLVTGKPVYLACAFGAQGYQGDGPMAAYDMLGGYLKLLFGFLGFEQIHVLGVEATTAPGDIPEANLAQAAAQGRKLLEGMQR